MVDVTLIQRYVVSRIVKIGLREGCEFPNYGGKSGGLSDRIMNTFNIPESGHLQQCTDSKTGIHEFEKVRDLIASFIEAKKFEDIIDLYKELFNRDPKQEYSLMDWPAIIDGLLTKAGYFIDLTLRIESKGLHVGYKSVENAFKAACENCEKASTAKDLTHYEKYVDKLGCILDQYPYLQVAFIKQMFGEEYFKQLVYVKDIDQARFNQVKATIKERFMEHTQKEVTTIMVDKMKSKHPPAEPYIQFMGTQHLLAPVVRWEVTTTRFAQECALVRDLMISIANGKKANVSVLKALIHRSPNQKALCAEIFISPDDFKDFDSYDRRKRGMILDEMFDKIANPVKTEVKKEEDPMPSFPRYPNLTEEEEPVKDSLYMQLIKAAHPEAYETIKVSGDESEENINAILSHHVKGLGLTDLPKPSFRYELPEDKRTGVIIKGNPEDPMVQELAAMFKVDIDKVKPVESSSQEPSIKEILSNTQSISNFNQLLKMLENRPTFKSRLNENLEQRKTGMDHFNKIEELARQLDGAFKGLTGIDPATLNGECKNPECPVHGDDKVSFIQDLLKTKRPDGEELHHYQLRIADLIVGIDPVKVDDISIVIPGGKMRQPHPFGEIFTLGDLQSVTAKGPFDFSGALKFMKDHYDPEPKKPTVSEIETTTHAVINQSFIIRDVKGEFFCEYKMTWSPGLTRFMFSHDLPDAPGGRQFHHIRDLTKRLTQDEAFKEFQSLRRVVIANGAHNPKQNPHTGY